MGTVDKQASDAARALGRYRHGIGRNHREHRPNIFSPRDGGSALHASDAKQRGVIRLVEQADRNLGGRVRRGHLDNVSQAPVYKPSVHAPPVVKFACVRAA